MDWIEENECFPKILFSFFPTKRSCSKRKKKSRTLICKRTKLKMSPIKYATAISCLRTASSFKGDFTDEGAYTGWLNFSHFFNNILHYLFLFFFLKTPFPLSQSGTTGRYVSTRFSAFHHWGSLFSRKSLIGKTEITIRWNKRQSENNNGSSQKQIEKCQKHE